MRSRREIVSMLEHFKDGTCSGSFESNAKWIAALEWVLGGGSKQPAAAGDGYERLLEVLRAAAEPIKRDIPEDASPERLRIELTIARANLANNRFAVCLALERLE
jgi:hypothetical protein